MKIQRKLFIGFLLIFALMFTMFAVSAKIFSELLKVDTKIQGILTRDMLLDEAVRDHLVWTNELINRLLLDTPFTGKIDPYECAFGKWFYTFEADDPLIKKLHNSLSSPHLALHASAKKALQFYASGEKEKAESVYSDEINIYMQVLLQQVLRLSNRSMVLVEVLNKQHLKMQHFLVWLNIAIHFAAFILAILISIIISRQITVPLNRVISKMKAFNVFENSQIEESPGGNDEVAELIRAFNLLSSELRQTREKMIAIADPLFAVDNDLKITYFSEAAERFTGFAAKDVAGLRCEDVLKSDLCRYNCIMKVVLETGRPLNNFEASIRTKAGKNIPILLSAAALRDASGNIIGGIEVFKDISVLKSTLRELEQTRDKLSRRERLSLLGQLSGGLAHELNTPLARIKLTLEYLKRAESEGLKMAVPLLSDYF